jgi:predicted transposase/invertase (TIGR01784 family)
LSCIFEIQVDNEQNIEKRSIFYTSRLYTEQMAPKMKFEGICPVIAINILDFQYLPFEEYHNRYRLKNTRNNHELTDVFEINFIELPKVSKKSDNSLKELWMLFLAAEKEDDFEMVAKEDPILEKAVNKLLYVSADEKLRYELHMREKAELDYWSAMATNYDKGKAEGIEQGIGQGREQGKEEKAYEAALRALRRGAAPEDIAHDLELPLERVLEIKTNIIG